MGDGKVSNSRFFVKFLIHELILCLQNILYFLHTSMPELNTIHMRWWCVYVSNDRIRDKNDIAMAVGGPLPETLQWRRPTKTQMNWFSLQYRVDQSQEQGPWSLHSHHLIIIHKR